MSDFRSLLSNFEAATSQPNITTDRKRKTNDKTSKVRGELSLKDSIQRLYQSTQIRHGLVSTTTNQSTSKADSSSSSSLSDRFENTPIHLALCACIVNDFPHEHVWKSFFSNTTASTLNSTTNTANSTNKTDKHNNKIIKYVNSADIYLHAKHPSQIKSSWVKSKTISTSYKPNWNDVQLVRAMLELSSEALKNHKTTHILFITESCIPIASLDEVCDYLRNKETNHCKHSFKEKDNNNPSYTFQTSYINAYDGHDERCTRHDEHECWNILQSQGIPYDAIYKSLPGWNLFSRTHIQSILNLPQTHLHGQDLWPLFQNVWAPEEVYFATCMSLLGWIPGPTVHNHSIMYAKWDTRARNHADRAHPFVYDGMWSEELVQNIRKREECLFMRKFKRALDLGLWEQVILNKKKNGDGVTFGHVDRGKEVVERRKRGRDDHHEEEYDEFNRRIRNR